MKRFAVTRKPDVVCYQFHCKHFPQQYVMHACHNDSTSNLKRHINTCAAIEETEAAGQLTIPMFAGGSAYSEPRLCLLLVQWCTVKSDLNMLIMEDEAFLKIMKMMHAHVAIPSAVTLACDIQRVYNISKKQVQKVLAESPGWKHIILNEWSSPNVLSILGVDMTFIKDGKIVNITLDCVP
ncbi:hypothetical protein C8R42DRAFT_589704 [Lentinula raphanica]|nr:hypothetical protein C8R42DRAFT_589704 [Lentinula raphanica]